MAGDHCVEIASLVKNTYSGTQNSTEENLLFQFLPHLLLSRMGCSHRYSTVCRLPYSSVVGGATMGYGSTGQGATLDDDC